MGQQQKSTAYDKQLVALGRVLQTLREEENVDVLIETTLSYIQAEFEYSLIWIGLYDRLEHKLLGKGGRTPQGDAPILHQRFILNPGDIMEQVVIQQRAVGVPDLREESRGGEWRKAAQQFNIQGTIMFPIRYKDRCFGVTLLGSTLWGVSPRSEEKARLSTILGGLGAALFQIEMEWQRQLAKRPHEPLISLLGQLRSLPTLDQFLETLAEETHQFVKPTRTNIYWFEREKRYFWRRASNRAKAIGLTDTTQSASGITVADVSGFYQALISDQVVSIGEAHSSLKADITGRLMQLIRARSLLAAPISFKNELLGFLAVEGNEARIWQDEEKKYVRGAAHLIALFAPLAERDDTIKQIKLDQELTAGVTRAIYTDADWKATLDKTAEKLCTRLGAERFVLLAHNRDLEQFEIIHQRQPPSKRPITNPFNLLNDLDRQLLEQSPQAISIESWPEDFKCAAWKDNFLEVGIRSIVLCNTAIGHSLTAVLIVGHEKPRTWNRAEEELVCIVSQQIGVILRQWQLNNYQSKQQELYNLTLNGLNILHKAKNIDRLEHLATDNIAKITNCSLASLITWSPARLIGRVVAPVVAHPQFGLNTTIPIQISQDPLITSALNNEGMTGPMKVSGLPSLTRQWLSGAGIGQVLVIPLRTVPEYQSTAIMLLGDVSKRRWSEDELLAIQTFVYQLAWSRRYLILSQTLQSEREELERLNWYKQRRIEELYRSVTGGVKKLGELSNQKDALTGLRYQQLLRQISNVLTTVTPLLKHEQWQLVHNNEIISLASLLRRSLERVDRLIKQLRLWAQIHREGNLSVRGDMIKLELVLYEILTMAARRSPPGGRIDIWCRPIDSINAVSNKPEADSLLIVESSSQFLEISITDNGGIDSRLLTELRSANTSDSLVPSTLDHPPGLHLLICQRLMKQMGGDFDLYQLEDGRVVSRLIIPLATET